MATMATMATTATSALTFNIRLKLFNAFPVPSGVPTTTHHPPTTYHPPNRAAQKTGRWVLDQQLNAYREVGQKEEFKGVEQNTENRKQTTMSCLAYN